MKNFLIILISSLLIFSYSCEKGLEPELYGELNPTTFPANEAEYELYMMEVYKTFTGKWSYSENGTRYCWVSGERGIQWLFDWPTDQCTEFTEWGGQFRRMSRADFVGLLEASRSSSHFEKVRIVSRITKIIGDLEEAEISDAAKNQFIAEAKVARAWNMFYLLHLYGPLAVIMDPDLIGDEEAESNTTRPDRSTYVGYITSDLRSAADNLPRDMSAYGRFNKGLALTLLMRTYMNEHDFMNAESVGREIMALNYELIANYWDLFREGTEQNNENIFAISCTGVGDARAADGNNNVLSWYCFPPDFPGNFVNGDPTRPSGGWGNPNAPYMMTYEWYDSFDPDDQRREPLYGEYIATRTLAGGVEKDSLRDRATLRGAVIRKFKDEGVGPRQGNDFIIARYADVLLMMSECINENYNGPNQEAIDLMNLVRVRAGIPQVTLADFAGVDDFNDAILQERGWELYFEGLRLFDIVRHGKWPDIVNTVQGKLAVEPLHPIPRYAIDQGGGITQNPGYY